MTNTLSAAWDRHADLYGRLFAPLTGFAGRAMVNMLAPRLGPDARVLDIACGTGAATVPAVERALRLGAGHVTATDFSPVMVERTRRALATLGAGESTARCEVHDGEALGFPDASFDAAMSCFGIFLFGDRRAGWREAARVLRPGATFATAVWMGPADNPMLRHQMEPVGRALPPRLQQPPPKGTWMEISTAETLAAEVTETGAFRDARVYPVRMTFAVGAWTELWDAMRDNPVMGAMLAQCDEGELARVKESVLARLREVAGGDDQPLLLEAACNVLLATRA
jgi:ubiquinone/menaquinone biosynthesis C-methylase UbiE